jgi:pyruvate dehydrogenase E1 component alpha subunit
MSGRFSKRLRAFEHRILQNLDKIRCPVHLSLGSEDISEALHACVRKDDWVFSTHRNHSHYLAKGGSEDRLWDEICGLESGINGGLAGSQCFSDPSINFHASSIVGGSIGIAVGTALALRGSGNIVFCCFGDAATEQGVFWESLNFSVLKKLPITFICENNGLSINVPIQERQADSEVSTVGVGQGVRHLRASGHLCKRVSSFGISTRQISGNSGFEFGRHNEPYFIEVCYEREGDHCYFPKQ